MCYMKMVISYTSEFEYFLSACGEAYEWEIFYEIDAREYAAKQEVTCWLQEGLGMRMYYLVYSL